MTTTEGITDEMLMAYADGQLAGAEALAVEAALAEDEGLATRVAMLADARQAVQQAYRPVAPVSAALEAQVRAMIAADAQARQAPVSNVIPLAARRKVVPVWQLPIAAALALAVGAGSVWLTAQPGTPAGGLQMASLADPAVAEALTTQAAGSSVDLGNGARLIPIATFRDQEDQLCREFEHDQAGNTVVAVACHDGDGWDLRFAIASAAADAEGYAPAASLETLDAYMSSTGAGAPLAPTDETAALQALN